MDPQESYLRLLNAWINREWEEVAELSQALLDWLDKGGFPPEPHYPKEMGNEWNTIVVRAICDFAVSRANSVLEDENGIPSEIPFRLTCINCQEDGPTSFAESQANGWDAVQYVPNSIYRTFLGICPRCTAEDKLIGIAANDS